MGDDEEFKRDMESMARLEAKWNIEFIWQNPALDKIDNEASPRRVSDELKSGPIAPHQAAHVPLLCATCSQPFAPEPGRPTQIYCSTRCRKTAEMRAYRNHRAERERAAPIKIKTVSEMQPGERRRLDNERGLQALAAAYASEATPQDARVAAHMAGASFKAIAMAENAHYDTIKRSMSTIVRLCCRCGAKFVGGRKFACDACRDPPPKPRSAPKTKEQRLADSAEWYRAHRANNDEWREENKRRAKAWREKQKRHG